MKKIMNFIKKNSGIILLIIGFISYNISVILEREHIVFFIIMCTGYIEIVIDKNK